MLGRVLPPPLVVAMASMTSLTSTAVLASQLISSRDGVHCEGLAVMARRQQLASDDDDEEVGPP